MSDGVMWLAGVNLVIWTGLFLYLLRLDRKLRHRQPSEPDS